MRALLVTLEFSPGTKIDRVEADAEYVGGDESELRSAEADEADDYAVDSGQNPALPAALSYQNGRNDRKYAGQVIKPERHRQPPSKFEYAAPARALSVIPRKKGDNGGSGPEDQGRLV
jgi:hypothetical protein